MGKMKIAAQSLLKDWTREQWDEAIKNIQAQPTFFHGIDLAKEGSEKTYFTSFRPMNFKLGANLKFQNRKYKVIDIIHDCCIEIKHFKRKSKGWRKHIRLMKANAQ